MIFNEWTDVNEHPPPYGKLVLILFEDEQMSGNKNAQSCLMGQRIRTDHMGDVYKCGAMEMHTDARFGVDSKGDRHYMFVTHWMEMPARQLYPLSVWEKENIAKLAKDAVKVAANHYGAGGIAYGQDLVEVKDPTKNIKLIKKP